MREKIIDLLYAENVRSDCGIERLADEICAIDPVKHGRWVKRTDENCWWYECSECGGYPMKNVYGHEELSAYCPHCGARMEGEEDG